MRPSCLIYYVDDPRASAAFYASLFGFDTLESHPTFAMLDLGQGMNLGFWTREQVSPSAPQAENCGEVAFAVENAAEADAFYANVKARGFEVIQEPVQLDFGYSLLLLDPDGNRLRVYAPNRE